MKRYGMITVMPSANMMHVRIVSAWHDIPAGEELLQ